MAGLNSRVEASGAIAGAHIFFHDSLKRQSGHMRGLTLSRRISPSRVHQAIFRFRRPTHRASSTPFFPILAPIIVLMDPVFLPVFCFEPQALRVLTDSSPDCVVGSAR